MTGAGIMLLSDGTPQGSICTTDAVSALIEELQFTLGEGPCVDAHREHVPIVEPDLAAPATARWTEFARSAVAAGARAVFGFPVSIGETHIGALNLYRDRPGPLTEDQHADAIVAANVVAQSIMEMQRGAPLGVLGFELDLAGDFRVVVHQAAGMIAVQLGVPVDEALVRLRSHAFGTGRPVSQVAADVTQRRLRFDSGDDE